MFFPLTVHISITLDQGGRKRADHKWVKANCWGTHMKRWGGAICGVLASLPVRGGGKLQYSSSLYTTEIESGSRWRGHIPRSRLYLSPLACLKRLCTKDFWNSLKVLLKNFLGNFPKQFVLLVDTVLTAHLDAVALLQWCVIHTQQNVYVNLEVTEKHAESVRMVHDVN